MAQSDLTQAEADALIALEKHRTNEQNWNFPMGGESISVPLQSADTREQFLLDMSRGRIDLRQVIGTPHIHVYREGYGDKWAFPLPADFQAVDDLWTTLDDFFRYCNVTRPPLILREFFT